MSQKVLITAGGSGIGFATASAFAAAGAKVFVCDIDSQALEAATIPGSAELVRAARQLCRK